MPLLKAPWSPDVVFLRHLSCWHHISISFMSRKASLGLKRQCELHSLRAKQQSMSGVIVCVFFLIVLVFVFGQQQQLSQQLGDYEVLIVEES